MYKMVYATTQGSDHIKHGILCEDSGLVLESEECRIFAVADGHGDSNCPRSQFGSNAACRIAAGEMEAFCTEIHDHEWEAKLLSEDRDTERLIRQLVTSIAAKWIKTVREDLETSPLTDEEKAGCTRYLERYDRGERLEHIYGTTLIAALMTDSYLLLIQQGDGRCVVFDSNGAVSQPIPWDDRCFANVTTSMCDEDVIQSFRYCVIDLKQNSIAACLAGSDGVEDSFPSMDMMHVYYRNLLLYASENGAEALNEHLAETLPEFSRNGSGDDVTICGIIDPDSIAGCKPAFERDNTIVRQESRLHDLRERLTSMNGMGKLEALKKRFEEASETAEEKERLLQEATRKLEEYHDDLQQMEQDEADGLEKLLIWNRLIDSIFPGNRKAALEKKVDELKERQELAEQQAEQSQEEMAHAEAEYREYLAKQENLEKEIEAAQAELDGLREEDGNAP